MYKNPLKINKCPKCNKDLDFNAFNLEIVCSKCDFKITPEKMRKAIEETERNLERQYDKTPAKILCDICGSEFDGQAWMLKSNKKIKCPECYRDTRGYLK